MDRLSRWFLLCVEKAPWVTPPGCQRLISWPFFWPFLSQKNRTAVFTWQQRNSSSPKVNVNFVEVSRTMSTVIDGNQSSFWELISVAELRENVSLAKMLYAFLSWAWTTIVDRNLGPSIKYVAFRSSDKKKTMQSGEEFWLAVRGYVYERWFWYVSVRVNWT